mmetsp:Transcript_24479/g.46433  ORF Transcript_24479/g.46433 Transcript_24479/m.46433 type:complete len:207 (-) Transcript_24479:80-700(-)
MAFGVNFMKSMEETIERELRCQARQTALWRQYHAGDKKSSSLKRRRHWSQVYNPDIETKRELQARMCQVAGSGYGRAAAFPPLSKDGISAPRPNDFVPEMPKRENSSTFSRDYIFAVSTGTGRMMWAQNVSHAKPKERAQTASAQDTGELKAQLLSRSASAPSAPSQRLEPLQLSPAKSPPKRLVRKARATEMGFMIWPQDAFVVS